jgi:hypothetical protein
LLVPNVKSMRAHFEAIADPALGMHGDGLIECAYESKIGSGPDRAKLFALHEGNEATSFAAKLNREGLNVYLGVSLLKPGTDRNKRTSAKDFYAGYFLAADIDTYYNDTRAKLRKFAARVSTFRQVRSLASAAGYGQS